MASKKPTKSAKGRTKVKDLAAKNAKQVKGGAGGGTTKWGDITLKGGTAN